MVSLNPGDRKHHSDKREHTAGAVEEGDAAVSVIHAHDLDQAAVLTGVVDEVIKVAEGIDHDVKPDQTHQTDDKHLDELAQHVAIDDRSHASRKLDRRGRSVGDYRGC